MPEPNSCKTQENNSDFAIFAENAIAMETLGKRYQGLVTSYCQFGWNIPLATVVVPLQYHKLSHLITLICPRVLVLQRTYQCEPWYWLLKNFFEVYLLHFTAKHHPTCYDNQGPRRSP